MPDFSPQQLQAIQAQGEGLPLGTPPQMPPQALLIRDFGSRGWDPTHPDEQLMAGSGAPAAQFSIAQGAPVASPDMHDVDFWNGWLNKRNGKTSLLSQSLGASILGLYMFAFTSGSGAAQRILVAVANAMLNVVTGNAVSAQLPMPNWANALSCFFASVQNLLFISPAQNVSSNQGTLYPMWWDGSSAALGYVGNRLSPQYAKLSGNPYQAVNILNIVGNTISIAANQPASGLFVGMTVYLDGGNALEAATVASFTATGTQGTANYYVTSIIVQDQVRYPVAGYSKVSWNGCVVVASSAGGSITTSGVVTTIQIMAVTTLKSGGQRASLFSIDVPAGNGGAITLENMDFFSGSGHMFGSDIIENSTLWLMTQPFNPQAQPGQAGSGVGQIFYLIPATPGVATNITAGLNPNSNSSVQIFASPDPTTWLQAAGALALDSQGYLTGQVDAPLFQSVVSWQGFLVAAGDPWNPSRLWISAYGAPQVWGTQGGLDGAYLPIPLVDDGQVITGLYVSKVTGTLYVFKTNSIYALSYTGSSLTPFQVQACQGNYSPLSPKLVWETDLVVTFLSEAGECVINGLSVQLVPESAALTARLTGPDSWALNLLAYAQCLPIPAKKQIWFQVGNAEVGDQTLVYDWGRRVFWYNTGSAQERCLFSDFTIDPPQFYGGDAQGQIWMLDQPGTDETIPVDFHWETPWLDFGDPTEFKYIRWIDIGGALQAAGSTLTILVYRDFNPKPVVYTMNMNDPNFRRGLYVSPGAAGRARYFKVALVNNTAGIPVAIRYMKITYENEGPDR